MIGSKRAGLKLIKDLFEVGRVYRPPYILWGNTLAPRLIRHTVTEQLSDPGLIFANVTQCMNLFSPDAVVAVFSPQFPISACTITANPISIRLERSDKPYVSVLDGITRVCTTFGKDVAIIAALPGPVSLARQVGGILRSDFDTQISIPELLRIITPIKSGLVTSLLECGVTNISIVEKLTHFAQEDASIIENARNGLNTLANIVSHHGKSMMLVVNDCPLKEEEVKSLKEFSQFDAFLIHPDSTLKATELPGVVGWTLPDRLFDKAKDLEQNKDAQTKFLRKAIESGPVLFLSTHQEMPDTASFSALRAFSSMITSLNSN